MLNQTENNCQHFFSVEVNNTLKPTGLDFLTSLFANLNSDQGRIYFLTLDKNTDPENSTKRIRPIKLFTSPSELDSTYKMLMERKDDFHIFFSPAMRGKGIARKDGISEIFGLIWDIDINKFTPEKKKETLRKIQDFPLQLSFTINSGGGIYLGYILREPSEDIGRVENILRRGALYFNGDMASTDAGHLFRVPGSINHKYSHQPVTTIENYHPERQYNLSDFDILPQIENQDIPIGTPKFYQEFNGDDPHELTRQAIERAYHGNRNDTGFALARALRDAGLSYDECIPFIESYAEAVRNRGPIYHLHEAEASLKQVSKLPLVKHRKHKKEMSVFDTTLQEEDEILIKPNTDIPDYCGKVIFVFRAKKTKKLIVTRYYCKRQTCPACFEYIKRVKASEIVEDFRDTMFVVEEIPASEYDNWVQKVYRNRENGALYHAVTHPFTGKTVFFTNKQLRGMSSVNSKAEFQEIFDRYAVKPNWKVIMFKSSRKLVRKKKKSEDDWDAFFLPTKYMRYAVDKFHDDYGCGKSRFYNDDCNEMGLSDDADRFLDLIADSDLHLKKIRPIFNTEDPFSYITAVKNTKKFEGEVKSTMDIINESYGVALNKTPPGRDLGDTTEMSELNLDMNVCEDTQGFPN